MGDFMNDWTAKAEVARQGEVLPSAQESHDLEQAARRDEDSIIDLARANALKALRYEDQLLDKVKDSRDVPQALRAVADARSKSVETLMKLTGRDVHRPSDDFIGMMQGLASKGLVKMNVNLEVGNQEPTE
jgi:plasmid stabilization system protein ParE